MQKIIEKFFKKINDAAEKNNYSLYQKIINKFEHLDCIESDTFREIFYGGTFNEIKCWINCPVRQLTVHDLFLIPIKYDKLFYLGLNKDNLSFESVSGLGAIFNEQLNDEDLIDDKKKIIMRLHAVLSDKRFPRKEILNFYEDLICVSP